MAPLARPINARARKSISELLNSSQPSVSSHLNILSEYGFVNEFPYGRDLTEKEFHLGGSLGSEVMKALIAGEFVSLKENSRIIAVVKRIKDWIEA